MDAEFKYLSMTFFVFIYISYQIFYINEEIYV